MKTTTHTDAMTDQVHISPADFATTKAGYRKYIMALGFDNQTALDIVSGKELNAFVMSFGQFKNAGVTAESKIDEMYSRLESMNEKWDELVKLGQDDNDMLTDAYHIRRNIRNLIDSIERLEK